MKKTQHTLKNLRRNSFFKSAESTLRSFNSTKIAFHRTASMYQSYDQILNRSNGIDDILQKLLLKGDMEAVERLLRQNLETSAAEAVAGRLAAAVDATTASGAPSPTITNPVNFRMPSAYLVTRRMRLRGMFSIFFRMKTVQLDGLILFAAGGRHWQHQHPSATSGGPSAFDEARDSSDFVAVEMVKGVLRYVYNVTGTRTPRVVRANVQLPMSDNRWHDVWIMRPALSKHIVRVNHTARFDFLHDAGEFNLESTVDSDIAHGTPAAAAAGEGGHSSMTVLYVGGVPEYMYDMLPKQIKSRRGFQGCLASVDLDGDTDGLLHSAEVPPEHQSHIGDVCQGRSFVNGLAASDEAV
jgi:hypothetical protein